MIFDTHTHYDDKAFDSDREELIVGLPHKGVGYGCYGRGRHEDE